MSTPILATKLYIPPPRPKVVLRPRLIARLNEGMRQSQGFGRKLTIISAPAGFGKTTLISEWIAGGGRPAAWLSLDEGDNDLTRFVAYLVAAIRTIAPGSGEGVLGALRAPRPPATDSILTILLNEITMMFVGLAGLTLCYTLYKNRLVPPVIAIWGLGGYAIHLGRSVFQVLGFDLALMHTSVGGLWELFIGVWLIAKGFNSSVFVSLAAKTRNPVDALVSQPNPASS